MSNQNQNNKPKNLIDSKFQLKYIDLVRSILSARFSEQPPLAFVHTFGCQGNIADSERIKGMLSLMGYEFCSSPGEADLILFNTCAVREHAEDRVFGNVGALKPLKMQKPEMLIALCGCMMQQDHIEEKIRKSYPFVNLVFGTFAISKFPQLIFRALSGEKRVFETVEDEFELGEGLPIFQDRPFKAWLPIVYGCDNFCSYCIVPYVRGRERSRLCEDVINEAKSMIEAGAKDITLLGQNVNSYGKNLDEDINFSQLLCKINELEGDFIIRFMTSHPKDCSKELLETMADCKKVARHLHLPFQSGSNRILKEMRRGYTREEYLDLIKYAKELMPDLSITSDVIVGFPGEEYDDFIETLSLVKEVEFTSLFTFIYSKRKGTKAAEMNDPIPYKEKSKWFKELTDMQESIAAKRTQNMKNNIYRVLVEEYDEGKNKLTGRTSGNISILFDGSKDLIGQFANVRVTDPKTWVLYGELHNNFCC